MEDRRHTLLITGFDPFGGETLNPSYEAVKLLPDVIGGITLRKLLLPTSYHRAPEVLRTSIDAFDPDFVILLGQAGGRRGVTPERIAINCIDTSIADNDGVILTDTPIDPDGKAAYFSTLPIRKMVDSISALGIPASISNSAGTFVCNRVMYEALRYLELTRRNIPAGFIHIPYTPSQTEGKPDGTPSLELTLAVSALEAAIKVLI